MNLLLIAAMFPALASAETLTLKEAERRASESSPQQRAALASWESARFQTTAQGATLYPRLSLEGNFRYVSEVPEIQLGSFRQPFGDHESYSIGPAITYTLWDAGGRSNTKASFALLAEAREQELAATRRQVLLGIRSAYAQAQLAQEEVHLARLSLELSRGQSKDIGKRLRAGGVSRLDFLNARTEVASYELREAQSRGNLEAALAELGSWIGPLPPGLQLEPLENSAALLARSALPGFSAGHPQIIAQEKMVGSLAEAASAQAAQHWPVIQAQAKSSWDYPNGPRLERIHQNSVVVNLSWSLFEWGRVNALGDQKRAEAKAVLSRKEQAEREFRRDWEKAAALSRSLLSQRESARKIMKESEELARLNYLTYKAGRLSFLEVQTANLRLLEARIRRARIDAQFLLQRHLLTFLSPEENP